MRWLRRRAKGENTDSEEPRGRRAEPPPAVERETGASPRAELLVAGLLILTALVAAAFVVLYVVAPDTQLLGLTFGLALAALAAALLVAGARVAPREQAA